MEANFPKKACLGFDTSNYTTSAALFGDVSYNRSRLLPVPQGSAGLRQSDALFAHVKALPEVLDELFDADNRPDISCIAASTRPRAVEGSYMPCFLAGANFAKMLAATMQLPFYAVSHQQGHCAAAAYSAGVPELLDAPFLAWHLSGGTTELLRVIPDTENPLFVCTRIGGTNDISAGQCIDRCGVALGLAFPCGAAIEALAISVNKKARLKPFVPKLSGLEFSLSGLESKFKGALSDNLAPQLIAAFVLDSISGLLSNATAEAIKQYPEMPVLCGGGVMSCHAIRDMMTSRFGAHCAEPEFSRDNAIGVAMLGDRLKNTGYSHETL